MISAAVIGAAVSNEAAIGEGAINSANPMVIVVMGVSGCGKTTIGVLLAQVLGWQFVDADQFHSAGNIAKMQQGIPLTDRDRQPWLETVRRAIEQWLHTQTPTVLACSALKMEYRRTLYQPSDPVRLVYLKGSFELIQQRLRQRQHHYMNPGLLQSQFQTLEEPQSAIVVEAALAPTDIVQTIIQRLKDPVGRSNAAETFDRGDP